MYTFSLITFEYNICYIPLVSYLKLLLFKHLLLHNFIKVSQILELQKSRGEARSCS